MIKRDILESVIDVGSGFFIAVIIQLTIFPLFDLHPTIFDSFGIAIIFTAVFHPIRIMTILQTLW